MYDVLPQTDTLHLRYTISLGKLVVNTSDDRPNKPRGRVKRIGFSTRVTYWQAIVRAQNKKIVLSFSYLLCR